MKYPSFDLNGLSLFLSSINGPRRTSRRVLSAVLGAVILPVAGAQDSVSSYKKLSLRELMEMEVTSVSRRAEKLTETASAIQVITGEDIHRSGATSLPEALRLLSNLQVAQVNSSQWAISARGFNNVLANKLLVLIDGRTVYTPLYAGVFWDVQDVVMEDVDRIEVISGPGGTLWGANAVNGVINLITKDAKETQGLFVETAAGNELQKYGAFRYGGAITPRLHYRVYAKTTERDSTLRLNGTDAGDEWTMHQGGFRADWEPQASDMVTLQADFYKARPNPDGTVPVKVSGRNVLGRWKRTLSEKSGLQLQWYYDYTWRDFGNRFTEALDTWDFDGQHSFPIGDRHRITWGGGTRLMSHKVANLPLFGFQPGQRKLALYSAFLQDEIVLIHDRLRFIIGSKFEHNDFTGYEVQPNARVAWTPTGNQTIWAAVSRGVRTPARIDHDFYLKASPTLTVLSGDPDFRSEEVMANELGWRVQPHETLSVSLSLFYNEYDHLRTAEPGGPPFGLPISIGNGVEAHTHGAELATTWQCTRWWRLRGGYTLLKKSTEIKADSRDRNRGTVESDDPEHQVVVQSSFDLPGNIKLDTIFRYMDDLPDPYVPSYMVVDINLGWRPVDYLELSISGQNLMDHQHPEFRPASPTPREIERSFYAKATYRW
jgi:iron complex outermembrane recepter protein